MAGRNTSETLQSDWIMPPMVGGIICFAATSTEVDVDLTLIAGTPAKSNVGANADDYNPNPTGHYLSLLADGGDIYVAFAAASASLGTLSTTAVTTVSGVAPAATNTATGTIKIPNGTTLQVKLPGGAPTSSSNPPDNADVGKYSPARYLGFLCASGVSATLRIWQSSP